jgi:serpin B
MQKVLSLRTQHARADGTRILELPYVGRTVVMLIVLPDKVDGLAAVEQSLDAPRLERWNAALQECRVDVGLPRFTIDPTQPLELSQPLAALGMVTAFSPLRADFTGMAEPPNPTDANRLHISSVAHKAFVRVDEKGTEAAAATSVEMVTMSSPPPVEPFNGDHPFLFFIVHRASGLVLFMGRVAEPS